jgi:hypothetical protein
MPVHVRVNIPAKACPARKPIDETIRQAASKCLRSSGSQLGHRLQRRYRVARDYRLAFEWGDRAAKQGVSAALRCVGSLYYSGNAIRKDYAKAAEMFAKAAAGGVGFTFLFYAAAATVIGPDRSGVAAHVAALAETMRVFQRQQNSMLRTLQPIWDCSQDAGSRVRAIRRCISAKC